MGKKIYKLRKTDMRCKKTVQGRHLMTVAKQISKRKFDLVGVQVRRERGGTEPAGEYIFFYAKGNESDQLGTCVLYVRES
jgi:hypothetical protein